MNRMVRRSVEASRAIEGDELHAARRRNRRLRALSAALGALLVAAVALGAFAARQRERADDKARLATATSLVRASAAASRPDLGLLLAAEAYRTEPSLD